jgi:MFS family permease
MSAPISASNEYTAGQRYAIMISAMLGYILDFYDVLIFPFLLPAIQRSMSLSLTEVGSLQALTLFGSAIGGALFGVVGDRFGRKTSLQLTIILFSVAALVSAFAWNYWSLAILRLITGIGLGGEYGVGMVLFNEAWKKGSRGFGAAALQGCAVIASSTASIVGIWLIATFSDEWIGELVSSPVVPRFSSPSSFGSSCRNPRSGRNMMPSAAPVAIWQSRKRCRLRIFSVTDWHAKPSWHSSG